MCVQAEERMMSTRNPWYFCRITLDTPPRCIADRFLESTRLETVAEDLLEAWDVVKVHERVVLSGNIRVRGFATAERSPRLELVVQPVLFATTEGDSVKDIDRR